LPPYIKGYDGDLSLYQTVYATKEESAAAPTAGLHFTEELLARIRAKGTGIASVDLAIGLDTFRPVEAERIEDHRIHSERFSVSQETIDAISGARARGGRVVAVGTTCVRSLESAFDAEAMAMRPCTEQSTRLFITPGYDFKATDALVTNFHLPCSTLLMLVSAFASREAVLAAYRQAVEGGYRFYSFGDAMLIL
jgi:S-adenosylmethionine:tRNA ribosyltransferase-isomerase